MVLVRIDMKRSFSLFCLIFLLWGCKSVQKDAIADLNKPQDAMLYAQKIQDEQSSQTLEMLKKQYLKHFFAPFVDLSPNPNLSEVFWIQNSLKKSSGFGENLEANSPQYTQKILEDMQIEKYPSSPQKAIMIKDANVRAVPSLKPMFSKPDGYPFDRWQNSLIFYGTPVLVTHYDASKRFAHIQTDFVYGWVEVSDLAFLTQAQVQEMIKIKNFVMPKGDEGVLLDKHQRYITQKRIGKLFMLDEHHRMLVFKRTSSGDLKIEKLQIDLADFHPFPQAFSQTAAAEYINLLMGQKYGWGGMYENRDCSAFIRDILGNFGLYLPRNSFAQAQYGTHQIKLDDLALKEKEKIIAQNASPFASVIWLKGHIMLYLGKDKEGNVIVAHSGWSVKSQDIFGQKEHKLGGVVITSLKPANEYNGVFFKSPTLGDRAKIVNNFYPALMGQTQ